MNEQLMKNKKTNTYTATDDALIKEVGNGIQAFVLSYILRRANFKKTTKPEIQKKFICDTLLMSKDIINSSIRKLENNGWLTTEVISRGSKTTVFKLSDKAKKYLNFNESKEKNTVSQEDKSHDETEQDNSEDLPWEDSKLPTKEVSLTSVFNAPIYYNPYEEEAEQQRLEEFKNNVDDTIVNDTRNYVHNTMNDVLAQLNVMVGGNLNTMFKEAS